MPRRAAGFRFDELLDEPTFSLLSQALTPENPKSEPPNPTIHAVSQGYRFDELLDESTYGPTLHPTP